MILKNYDVKSNGIWFQLEFKNNITLINGPSGVGKTLLFEAIRQEIALGDRRFVAVNYNDRLNGTLDFILQNKKNSIIVIDNADSILSYEERFKIVRDKTNQYIIFAHSVNGFYAVPSMIATLKVENGRGWLIYEVL